VPAISVIILNYNGRKWLPACLDALAAQRDAPAFETILVDNGSSDGSVPFVRTTYPAVRVLETGTNLGFAEGNNAGTRQAAGAWLAFLNNDTIAEPTWLAELAREAQAHTECALITSRLVYLHDPSIVDSAGDGYLRAGGAFKHGHGAPAAAFAASREVFGACGGAFMIRRDAFEALGGFDPRFFMVYEDVDLSYRARLRGMRVWYAAGAIVRHAGSGSLGPASAPAVFYGQRNLEWTWIKNTPRSLLLATAVSHAIYSFAGIAHYIRIGRGRAALGGKWAAVRALPQVLADRRRIQASRTATPSDVASQMEPDWIATKRREKAFDTRRRSSQREQTERDEPRPAHEDH
jgi:N-acetylglucosaminyl-diphospho-decaprenol L-rhamnosyltransferase